MQKEEYLEPEMEIIQFEIKDVIATSGFSSSVYDPDSEDEVVISGLSSFWGKS